MKQGYLEQEAKRANQAAGKTVIRAVIAFICILAWKIMQSDNGGECSLRLELAD